MHLQLRSVASTTYARDSLREHRLAGTRRTEHQHTLPGTPHAGEELGNQLWQYNRLVQDPLCFFQSRDVRPPNLGSTVQHVPLDYLHQFPVLFRCGYESIRDAMSWSLYGISFRGTFWEGACRRSKEVRRLPVVHPH